MILAIFSLASITPDDPAASSKRYGAHVLALCLFGMEELVPPPFSSYPESSRLSKIEYSSTIFIKLPFKR